MALTILLAIMLSALLISCEGRDQAVDVAFVVDPDPPGVGPSQLRITLTDEEGDPVKGAKVEVEGNMAHDGMQPLRARLKAGEAGQYLAPFSWTMSGDWTMAVSVSLPDGQRLRHSFEVRVDEGAGQAHDHGAGHGPRRLPNDGASIHLHSPLDGAIFEPGDEVQIEIAYDNFELGEDGNHWHVYVDGKSAQMIMGKMTMATLSNLEPGRHEVSAYLSVGSAHDELEEGDTVTILIKDPSSAARDDGEADHHQNLNNHQHD